MACRSILRLDPLLAMQEKKPEASMGATDPMDDWAAPDWHPDYGDPELELELLRTFCRAARSKAPDLEFLLRSFEAGGLCVDIKNGGDTIAELYVSDAGDALLSLFVVDDRDECTAELAFTDFEKGIAFLLASTG